ncbi:hypothetical protein FRB99_006316 [Tulasnella sp. 403]|nr:hypothetical protein FRB99_006316 [Tulasnella sp. 403]
MGLVPLPPVTPDVLSDSNLPNDFVFVIDFDKNSQFVGAEGLNSYSVTSMASTLGPTKEDVIRHQPSISSIATLSVPYIPRTRDFKFLPIPRRLRYHPDTPFNFTLVLNIIFGFASTAVIANIYYCQPLLINFAQSFGVEEKETASIPTLAQAGYGAGLLLITPLGDLIRRRPLLLLVLLSSTFLTLGVAMSPNLQTLQTLSFLQGVVSIVPQILIPFAADLAPPARRATAVSVVLSGLLLGVMLGRALAGLITQQSGSWRTVYLTGCGFQAAILITMYFVLPDWPSKVELSEAAAGPSTKTKKLTYFGVLYTMAKFAVTEPILIQGYLIGFGAFVVLSGFWTSLTPLLDGAPYHFSTMNIGLFGLVGAVGVMTAPFVGRLIDGLVHWVGVLIAICILFVGQIVMTAAGRLSIGAIVIGCITVDIGIQMIQVAATSRIYEIDPALRARMNAVFMIAAFIGQVVGSSVGLHIILTIGWRPTYATFIAFIGFMFVVLMAKGPHSSRYAWIGWDGGARLTKSAPIEAQHPKKLESGLREDNDGATRLVRRHTIH